ncbi:MAG TPA: glycosyltransferase [Kofleriaceae bacterium]|nr:glycosyltransferase [Kofleriaceae bacterium]
MALVGVVATSYPRWDGDAAGSFVEGHAAWLRARGDTVDVIAAGRGLPVPDGLFFDGGAPEAIEQALARGGAGVLAAAAGFSARMLGLVARRARRWDAVVAHWLAPSAVAAALATVARRIPMLAIAHGGDVHLLERARLLTPVLAALVARDARLVFVSDELRRRALDAIPRALAARVDARAIVQAMGVDDARSAAIATTRDARRDAGTSSGSRTVAVLARLVPVKSVDTAIAAMASLPTDVQLVIAGDGPLRAELTAQAARMGDRVRFAGWLGADARDALLAAADVVVVPSAPTGTHARTEGTPLAALEALAAGVPLVASATGGLRALANDARLVTPRDPAALAAAIESVLRAGSRSRAVVARDEPSRWGWRVVGEALDRHWRHDLREHRYAPAPHTAQSNHAQWSSRRSDSADPQSHSGTLPVTESW